MTTEQELDWMTARVQAAWALSNDAKHALTCAREDCERLIAEVRLLWAALAFHDHLPTCSQCTGERGDTDNCADARTLEEACGGDPSRLDRPDRKLGTP